MRREGGRWTGFRRILRLTGVRTVRDEVEDELRFHLEERTEELVAGGMEREAAEAEARRRFGDVAHVREACARIDRPSRRRRARGEALAAWGNDLRQAWRALLLRPGFTAVVVLTLALGIGANTAIFSGVDAVLLRPLPVAGLERMVVLRDDLPGLNLRNGPVSPAEAVDLLGRKELFEAAGAFHTPSLTLTGQGEARKVVAARTLGEYFALFGARPHLGRLYGPEDSREGSPHVVVLGHALWRELSGGDPSWLGRTLTLDGEPHELIGVLAPDFRFPRSAQLFTPYPLTARVLSPQRRGMLTMTAVARVHPGVTPERLATELAREAGRWHEALGAGVYPPQFRHTVVAQPFRGWLAGELRSVLLVLMGAVAFVLLVACANVASLQLVRTVGRARELAVRAALGAGWWPLVRQLLAESLVLAAAGGVAGLGLGALLVRGLRSLDAVQYPQLQGLALDPVVLAFTAGVTLLVALLAGTAPALRAARASPADALKEGGAGTTGGPGRLRFLRVSAVVQVALTLLLLLGSGLTVRSLARLLETDPGFRPTQALSLRLAVPPRDADSAPQRVAFFEAVAGRLRALPGVEAVGLVTDVPFSGRRDSSPFERPGRPTEAGATERHADLRIASGDYFRAMGIPLRRGRVFDGTEQAGGPLVAVIDEQLARQYFPGEDPVGQQLSMGEPTTIIGVVGSVLHGELGEPQKATVYFSHRQYHWVRELSVVLRSPLPPATMAAAARAAVGEVAPDVPVFEVEPLERLVHRSLGARRLAVAVLGAFAGLSLVLALLGIYGVVSYGTRQRTRELGIRMALGAQPADVVRLVLRGGLALAVWGVGVGVALFALLGRSLSAVLSGVVPLDVPVIALSAVLVGLCALLASYLPARRAARVHPTLALRQE